MNRTSLVALAALVVSISSSRSIAAVTYVARLLHPATYVQSAATGISGGVQMGAAVDPNSLLGHAVMWNGTANSLTDLHPATGYLLTSGTAIDGDTQVGVGAVGSVGDSVRHAVMWKGTAASLVDLHPRGFTETEARGVSDDTQVGFGRGSVTNFLDHALLWTGSAASVVDLHPPGFLETRVFGASGSSQVGQGSLAFADKVHALLWNGTAASYVDLGELGTDYLHSVGYGVSGNTQVGGAVKLQPFPNISYYHAFMWNGTAASGVDLHPTRGWIESIARGVSEAGQVGYGRTGLDQPYRALYWNGSSASVVNLHQYLSNLGTFTESQAFSINARGAIVGAAYNASGRTYAVMWVAVPEPASHALLAFALAIASMINSRGRRAPWLVPRRRPSYDYGHRPACPAFQWCAMQ